MNDEGLYIKFHRCKVGRHKGERWEKLEKVDVSKPATLHDVHFMHSDEFAVNGHDISILNLHFDAKGDTFTDITCEEWREIIRSIYGLPWVNGIVLIFRQGEYFFSTFRAYDVKKHRFYNSKVGKDFMVVEE